MVKADKLEMDILTELRSFIEFGFVVVLLFVSLFSFYLFPIIIPGN